MRTSLLFLPFVALLIGAVGTAVGSAMTDNAWLTPAAWGIAAGLVALWVSLDYEGFSRFFMRKGARYGAGSGLTVLLGLLVIIGAGMLSIKPRFNKSFDLSKSGINTLADQSIKTASNLAEAGGKVDVAAFFQDPLAKQKFQDLITLYESTADIFTVNYVDPQSDPTQAMAKNITTDTVIFSLGDRESRVTDFTEEKITNALVNLLKQTSKSIYFITGHGEYSIDNLQEPEGMGLLVDELKTQKYESRTLALDAVTKVPEDADAVIIAGPQYDFKEQETAMLSDYLRSGGALLVMADAAIKLSNLNAMLETFGVAFNNDLVILNENDPRAALIGRNVTVWSEFDGFHSVTKDFASRNVRLLVPNTRTVRSVENNEHQLKADAVGETSSEMQRITGVETNADLQSVSVDRLETGTFPVLAVAAGRIGNATLAENSAEENENPRKDVDAGKVDNGEKEVRVVIAGSSQFANNIGAQRAENKDLFINITNYLLQDESLISIRPKDIKKGTIDVSSTGSQIGLAFLLFVYPFLFLGGGLLYWLVRRRA